jgi:hypothetical protein
MIGGQRQRNERRPANCTSLGGRGSFEGSIAALAWSAGSLGQRLLSYSDLRHPKLFQAIHGTLQTPAGAQVQGPAHADGHRKTGNDQGCLQSLSKGEQNTWQHEHSSPSENL